MAYKDWLNEQASNKNAGMNNIKPADIPAAKQMAPVSGVKAPSTNAGGGNSTPTANTGATGAENGAGGTTGGSMTYEDWYATNKQHYDDLYQQTLAEIEANRQKNIQDATAAQSKLVGTYGAQAERLASMGLTGGGYSDYLTAQSHANMRSGVQAANATAEQSRLTAQQEYNKTMLGLTEQRMQREQQYNTDLHNITNAIDNGEYVTLEAVRTAAVAAGMSEDKINEFVKKQESQVANAIRQSLISVTETDGENGTTIASIDAKSNEEIDNFVTNGQITQATADALKQERDEKLVDLMKQEATDKQKYANFLNNYWDKLSPEQAMKLAYDYNVDIALDGLTSDNVGEEIAELQSEVDGGKLSEQDATALGAYKLAHVSNVYVPDGGIPSGIEYKKGNVDTAIQRSLTEFAGDKIGTIVVCKDPKVTTQSVHGVAIRQEAYPNSYVLMEDGWKAITSMNSDTYKKAKGKQYALPERPDSGYGKFLTE